jgi:hypothetical protein
MIVLRRRFFLVFFFFDLGQHTHTFSHSSTRKMGISSIVRPTATTHTVVLTSVVAGRPARLTDSRVDIGVHFGFEICASTVLLFSLYKIPRRLAGCSVGLLYNNFNLLLRQVSQDSHLLISVFYDSLLLGA